jgi:hypothetical protein
MIFDAYSDICVRVGVSPSPGDTDFSKINQLLKYTMTPALYLALRFSLSGFVFPCSAFVLIIVLPARTT